MSSAYYPLGMVNGSNRVNPNNYRSWKGKGRFSNPLIIASGNIRPLTNLDPANSAPAKFGLPRPIKHYRKGRSVFFRDNFEYDKLKSFIERQYYSNRIVKTTRGNDLISQTIDKPGSVSIKDNNFDCRECKGITLTSSYMPYPDLTENPLPTTTNKIFCCNAEAKAKKRVLPASTILKKNYYTTTYQKLFNRCQTFQQRRFNFITGAGIKEERTLMNNPFVTNKLLRNSKPGDPLSYDNYYVAICNPSGPDITTAVKIYFIEKVVQLWKENEVVTDEEADAILHIEDIYLLIDFIQNLENEELRKKATEIYVSVYNSYSIQNFLPSLVFPKACARVYYKPNNPRFAQQGAVSASTKILFDTVKAVETNIASLTRDDYASAAKIYTQNNTIPAIPFIYKNKVPRCNPALYTKNGNSKHVMIP